MVPEKRSRKCYVPTCYIDKGAKMNFSIHMDTATMTLLDELVKREKRSRSAVIREAVRELANLKQPKKRWSAEVEAFLANPQPLDGEFAGFEAYRAELPPLDPARFGTLGESTIKRRA